MEISFNEFVWLHDFSRSRFKNQEAGDDVHGQEGDIFTTTTSLYTPPARGGLYLERPWP